MSEDENVVKLMRHISDTGIGEIQLEYNKKEDSIHKKGCTTVFGHFDDVVPSEKEHKMLKGLNMDICEAEEKIGRKLGTTK